MDPAVIENEAMKLSDAERAVLVDRLLQTLETPNARGMQAWADEGERRLALFRAGKTTAVDGETVTDTLRKKLG